MEAAKNAVTSFLRMDGKHHTDVDESVNPAVTSETVKPQRHEESAEAVDRDVHRHHYDITALPPQHKEGLSERHNHNSAPQAEENLQHGSEEQDRSRTAPTPHGNPTATDSGVAGVAAGSVAAGLGRDHRRADQVHDLDPKDTGTSSVGDAGSKTTGTSLAGRADGNTPAGAATAASQGLNSQTLRGHESQAEQRPPERVEEDKPSNLSGGDAEQPKDVPADDNVQHASKQGQDPSLEKDRGKWTGTGTDGSHSAVFGLTPDGHTFDDTGKHPGGSGPPESESESKGEDSRKHESTTGGEDIGSREAASGKVAEQMHDPRVAEKGHEGQAEYTQSDQKPGAGA